MLSPALGKITHVLLTRAPLYRGRSPFSCDLHVLGAPLTFVLSQDQTLQLNLVSLRVVDSGLVELAELGLWLGLEIASFTPGRDGRGGFRVSVTYSSSPRGSLARETGRFVERTIQFSRTEGTLGSGVGGGTLIPCREPVKSRILYFVVSRGSAAGIK